MEYIIIAGAAVLFSLLYFRIANHYNIIDRPNLRSAHKEVTIRGGGVVYPFVFLLYLGSNFIFEEANTVDYTLFGLGLLMVCTVSFIDDILELSSMVRLIFQFMAVLFLFYFVGASAILPTWLIPVAVVVTIGILNAFNFMDGINGMSGLYSLITLITLYLINQYLVVFTDHDFILYPAIASLVFLFFNFRKKAVCFMGDVGSMGIAFWIAALVGKLMVATGELKWILLLTVYGVETVATIVERIGLRENIFKAHRRHLYQLLVNDKKVPHIWVSIAYASVQLLLSTLVMLSNLPQWIIIPTVILPTVTCYVIIKSSIKKQIACIR
jgi:UDP-N-acetylmuramyl pentapeptide phosphotransferase/UDP-N-acetylglucosamine-1-phosphate transferase